MPTRSKNKGRACCNQRRRNASATGLRRDQVAQGGGTGRRLDPREHLLALAEGEAVEERVTGQWRGIGIDGTLGQDDESALELDLVDDGGDGQIGVGIGIIVGDEQDGVGKIAVGQTEATLAGTMYASRPAPLVKWMVDAVAWKSYDTYHCAG